MSEIVEKPPTRSRIAGLAWAGLGCGVGGGFFLGAVFGAWLGGRVIAGIVGGVLMPLAAGGFLIQMGERTAVGALPRLALWLTSVGSGLLIGWAARAGADLRYSAQIEAWFGETTAKVGLVLLAVALILAMALSFRRPAQPRLASAQPLPLPPMPPEPPRMEGS